MLYLYVKTIERAHTPSKLWEKIKLSKNYAKALEQIDTELVYWPQFMLHRCKQRLTKITQYLIRMRRLKLKTTPKLIGIKKKLVRREERREKKAEAAARLEMSIEKELLDRLRKGVYGADAIMNESQEAFSKALDEIEELHENDVEVEDEFEDDELLDREFVSDVSEDEDDIEDHNTDDITGDITDDSDEDSDAASFSDLDSDDASEGNAKPETLTRPKTIPVAKQTKKSKRNPKGPRVEIEYEHEQQTQNQVTW